MFRWIIGTSLQFRFVVLGVAAALVVLGLVRLQKMPVDVLPEFAPPMVEVQTEALGLSAQEVESLVTLNLEELLSGVPWLESIRSRSVTGMSSILLTFQRGTDIMKARQMIQERLTLAYTLPNVAQPPVILQPLSATSRFMMIGVTSRSVEPTELSLLARWTMKPKLLGVPGVANVAIWGQRLRQLQVHMDPERLRSARISQDDVITAAGDALWVSPLTFLKGSFPGSGGWIDNRNQRLGVHHEMPIRQPEDMAKVPVGTQTLHMTGRQMALGDITEITFSHPPLIGDALIDASNGLLLVVEKLPSANTLEVTRGVEQAIAELARGLPGVQMNTTVFRLATYIEDSIANLAWAALAGLALVVLVVGAFLANWRTALIAVVSIPLALLAALLALHLAGETLNTMVLAGLVLALGVIIDDAVGAMEKLMQRLRHAGSEVSLAALICDTSLETRRVALYAGLIIVLAVAPVFFLGGLSGGFFAPLVLAYVLAVAASLLVALTVTPALSLLLVRRQAPPPSEGPAHRLAARLHRALEAAIRRPRPALSAAALVVLGAIALAPFLGQSLLPTLQERQIVVNWSTAPGTSWAETNRITGRLSRELQSLPGVRSVGAHVGRAITGDQVVGINSAQVWVSIARDADYERTLNAIRQVVEGYPGVQHSVQTYLRDRVGEALTGAAHAIVVRIYGPKREILNDKAEEVRKALATIPGIVDLRAEGQVVEPQVKVRVNLDAASKANVKPGDVRRHTANVFNGITVGFLFEEQKIYDVVVWGAPETRASLTNLADLWIERPDRQHVRLKDVASVSIEPTPTLLRHESIAPYVDVVANVVGRDVAAVAQEVEARLGAIAFPLEHHPKLLGEYVEWKDAQQRVLGVALGALIGIGLLLHAALHSWRLALIAFLALPASVAGGILAAAVTGGTLSLGSLIGFLAVVGVAARNSLLLIDHCQRLRDEQGLPFGFELAVRAVRERASPILGSTAAIVAALLPIVAFGPAAGLEIVQPTAIVIIGGILASTLVTLFVLPALYLAAGPAGGRDPELEIGEAA